MSESRRREGLGSCAVPFGRPEPQSQLPFLAQRPQAAPGAHGETWGRPVGRGGRAGRRGVCATVGSAATARGPLLSAPAECERTPCLLPRPNRLPGSHPRPCPGPGGEGARVSVAGGARSPWGEARSGTSSGPLACSVVIVFWRF